MKLKIIKSWRRRKTASGRIKNGILEIRLPAWISSNEAQKIIDKFTLSFKKRTRRKIPNNLELKKLADKLNSQYFQGRLKYSAVCWSERQNSIYGSCGIKNGTIRISSKLKSVPKWVLKAIIIHELTHLLVPNHSKKFWEIANRSPLMERARGYLLAFEKYLSNNPL